VQHRLLVAAAGLFSFAVTTAAKGDFARQRAGVNAAALQVIQPVAGRTSGIFASPASAARPRMEQY
jgi:hypothetical protein